MAIPGDYMPNIGRDFSDVGGAYEIPQEVLSRFNSIEENMSVINSKLSQIISLLEDHNDNDIRKKVKNFKLQY